ncbi:TetR/AcrR family transcriptional regulator C-terminal domain-containing protein [Kitasatospora saccharophila]|uniref:TetR/AcrR family transcriptional regulator C-terminal domain-containing protein n=1 Tax=Kitasatospora saccharophila TaxID=407973 RepID=A0ABP5JP91_9ACTN
MGRPRKALLDRQRITTAALELVDETGDFTVPELARRLGVQTASIYHHVDGRAGIVELLRARIGEEMDFSPLEQQPWDAALAGFARSYRAAFAAHPHLVPLLATTTVRAQSVIIEAYERMAGVLEDSGFPPEDVIAVLTALENLILGSALDLAAPDVMWDVPDGVDAPRLATALAASPQGPGRADRAFTVGLDALLHGFGRLLDDHPAVADQ